MELNGALSNPHKRLGWAKLEKALTRARAKKLDRDPSPEPPARAGATKQAVMRALELADHPLRLKEIHQACEDQLGRPISYDTVKDCVHKHARGPKAILARVNHGTYTRRDWPDPPGAPNHAT
jgi:hypothetical protein